MIQKFKLNSFTSFEQSKMRKDAHSTADNLCNNDDVSAQKSLKSLQDTLMHNENNSNNSPITTNNVTNTVTVDPITYKDTNSQSKNLLQDNINPNVSFDDRDVKIISKMELEKIKSDAFLEGVKSGIDQRNNTLLLEANNNDKLLQNHITQCLTSISEKINSLNSDFNTLHSDLNDQIIALSYTMTKKIIKTINNHLPEYIVKDFLEAKLQLIIDKSPIKIYVNDVIYSKIEEYLHSAMEKYSDDIKLCTDENLGLGECKIDWNEGIFIKNSSALLKEFELILENYLMKNKKIDSSRLLL